MLVHPDQFEAEVFQAVTALRAGCAARAAGAGLDDDPGPLAPYRSMTTRERFEELSSLPEGLANRESLRRWLAYLIIERVTWDDRVAEQDARSRAETVVEGLGEDRFSVRSLIQALLTTRQESRRAAIAQGLVRASGESSEAAMWWAIRRQGAALHLGLDGLSWLEAPFEGIGAEVAAERVIDATQDVAQEVMGKSLWQEVLWEGTAMEAREGWPALLTPRWFRSVFGGWKTLEGLRIDTGVLRQPVCGASFARALARFGTAVHRGCAERTNGPFSLVRRPFDASEASYGALFGSLLTSVPFLRRRLGLGVPAAREQARSLGISMMLNLRLNALRAIMSTHAAPLAMIETYAGQGARALCAEVPEALCGVIPRYDSRGCAWLAGAVQAAIFQRELVETYDEDWFDNPRAHERVVAVDVAKRLVLDEALVCGGAGLLGAWCAEVAIV